MIKLNLFYHEQSSRLIGVGIFGVLSVLIALGQCCSDEPSRGFSFLKKISNAMEARAFLTDGVYSDSVVAESEFEFRITQDGEISNVRGIKLTDGVVVLTICKIPESDVARNSELDETEVLLGLAHARNSLALYNLSLSDFIANREREDLKSGVLPADWDGAR